MKDSTVDPQLIILAALAAGGKQSRLDLLQVQHLLFLIDTTIPESVNGPHFKFSPSPQGPFDGSILNSLNQLNESGRLDLEKPFFLPGSRRHSVYLALMGYESGKDVLNGFSKDARLYLGELHVWVAEHDWQQRLARIQANFAEESDNRVLQSATLFERNNDPRQILIKESAGLTHRQAVLKSLSRTVDLFGVFNAQGYWLKFLQAARVEPKVSEPNPWVDVGDCLREAITEVASGFPSSSGDEETRVV